MIEKLEIYLTQPKSYSFFSKWAGFNLLFKTGCNSPHKIAYNILWAYPNPAIMRPLWTIGRPLHDKEGGDETPPL